MESLTVVRYHKCSKIILSMSWSKRPEFHEQIDFRSPSLWTCPSLSLMSLTVDMSLIVDMSLTVPHIPPCGHVPHCGSLSLISLTVPHCGHVPHYPSMFWYNVCIRQQNIFLIITT